jgi:aminoglycoside phosphotransferase family enzyme/predicted kinase
MNNILDILKQIIQPEEILETHISYIFITKEYVYKIKKGVNLGFLNFKELKDRKIYSLLEKELNNRFSKGIYLEVLKLVKRDALYELVNVNNTLPAYEYILKMKRIKDGSFLYKRLEKNEVSCDEMFNIGAKIAEKLKALQTDKEFIKEYGNIEILKFNINENFKQLNNFKNKYFDEGLYDFIMKSTYKFIDDNNELLSNRVKDGYIKDGHGDIRLEHIYFDELGCGIIDCIEFNKRFRCNDVVGDFVFLCMELDELGYIDFSDSALSGFLSIFNDQDSVKLINFYKCYRALVRAKVTCFLLEEKGSSWQHYEGKSKDIERLVNLAYSYALGMRKALTLIFYGLSGSGKSKNAKLFSNKFGCAYFNTDMCRKEMFNMKAFDRHYVPFGSSIYSEDVTLKVYSLLGEKACARTALGRLTVIDGTFLKKQYLDAFLDERQLKVFKIKCEASKDELMNRLQRRATKKSVSDGRVEILNEQYRIVEDIGCDFLLNTENNLEEHPLIIAKALMKVYEK